MKKDLKYAVCCRAVSSAPYLFETYEEAEKNAKAFAGNYKTDAMIYQLVAVANQPIPPIEVTKIT